MNLVKNITSIIVNLSKLAIHVEEIIDTLWISSEGEQIKRDYDDYDYIEYQEDTGRNRYGFPKQIKRGD